MVIHALNNEGHLKCGNISYSRLAAQEKLYNAKQAQEMGIKPTCKKCLGTVTRRNYTADISSQNLIGKVIRYSYGYDMTINEFFIITAQTPHSVMAAPIASNYVTGGGYTGEEVCLPDTIVGNPVRFQVKDYGGSSLYFKRGHHSASLIDPTRSFHYNTVD